VRADKTITGEALAQRYAEVGARHAATTPRCPVCGRPSVDIEGDGDTTHPTCDPEALR